MKIALMTVIAALVAFPSPAVSENIRVAIFDDQPVVTLKTSAGFLLTGPSAEGREKKMVFTPASVGDAPARIASTDGITQVNGRRYRGWVELRKKKNGLLLVVNELGLERYLDGVIASEIPHDWESEALKAQAVAARTYALYQKQTAGNRAYHVLSTVSSQVYGGRSGERTNAVRAVRDTEGLVLAYRGKLIPAFYHASCGGHTENAAELWGIDEPYLKGVDCECQAISKYGLWEKRISVPAVISALKRLGHPVNDIVGLNIGGITPAGRVKEVAFRSAGGASLVPAETLRAALGNTVIPSVFFELELLDNEAVFSGRGMGHGVGLCQWGAKEMAQRSCDYRAILAHYYPGTELTRRK